MAREVELGGAKRRLTQTDDAAETDEVASNVDNEIIAASAKHPFDHIQYGVSSLLSGQSSATGDPRAGGRASQTIHATATSSTAF